MFLEEALKESNKIRRKKWNKDNYILFNDGTIELWDNSEFSWNKNIVLPLTDIIANDWENADI